MLFTATSPLMYSESPVAELKSLAPKWMKSIVFTFCVNCNENFNLICLVNCYVFCHGNLFGKCAFISSVVL